MFTQSRELFVKNMAGNFFNKNKIDLKVFVKYTMKELCVKPVHKITQKYFLMISAMIVTPQV